MAYGNSAVAYDTNSDGTATISITPPDGAKVILVAVAAAVGQTFTWPAGFIQRGATVENTSNNGAGATMAFAEKPVAASEPGTYDVTVSTPGYDLAVAATYCTGRSSSGLASGNYAHTPGPAGTSGSSPVTCPLNGLTAANGSDVLVFEVLMLGSFGATVNWTPPSSYTQRTQINTTYAIDMGIASRDSVSAGATGTLTASAAPSASGGDSLGIVVEMPAGSGSSATCAWLRG